MSLFFGGGEVGGGEVGGGVGGCRKVSTENIGINKSSMECSSRPDTVATSVKGTTCTCFRSSKLEMNCANESAC